MATQSLIPPNINYGKLSADEYDPNATYSSGDMRIHDNILHKANQDISVAEPWTPAHWDATTIAAELKAQAEDISDLNSSNNVITDTLTAGVNISHNEHMVTLAISLASKTYTANTWSTIATIPEGLRPLTGLTFAGLNNSASADGSNTPTWLRVSTNGQVQVYAFYDRTNIAPAGMISYVI